MEITIYSHPHRPITNRKFTNPFLEPGAQQPAGHKAGELGCLEAAAGG